LTLNALKFKEMFTFFTVATITFYVNKYLLAD